MTAGSIEADPDRGAGDAGIDHEVVRAHRLASLGELCAAIAHELNNPLATIAGYAELLESSRDVGKRERGWAAKIRKEAERSRRLVENLLRYVRKEPPRREPVDVASIAAEVIELREYAFRAEGIALERAIAEGLPPVLGDRCALEQVVLNLLKNAHDAMREVHGPRGAVTIRARREGASAIAIEVADRGPGIRADVLPRLFDPFFTTKPRGKGTGLGLSLADAIVREHGGEIRVASRPGEGSVFTVVLPAAAREAAPARAAEPTLREPRRPREGEPLRVLLIDDEPLFREMLADVLADRGFRVEGTGDGREAMAWLHEGRAFDLVVSDIKMPSLSGRALWERLREEQPALAARLVFVSGDSVSDETRAFLRSTGRPILRKPFALDRLEAVLQQVARGERVVADAVG